MNDAHRGPERDPADELRHELKEMDRELAQVELADIVRLSLRYLIFTSRGSKWLLTFTYAMVLLSLSYRAWRGR